MPRVLLQIFGSLMQTSGLCVQEGDSTMRNPSFALRSPQSGCSPAGSEGTPKRMYYLASPLFLLRKTRFMHCDCLIMNGFFFFLLKFFVAALSIVWSLLLLLLLLFFYIWCCFFTAGSRPPLILQSPPPYTPSPREGLDQKQQLQQRKKTLSVKEEKDMYDIVSSNKDSTNLTLKLSRVKSNESDTPGNLNNNLR